MRRHDWPDRLAEAIALADSKNFEYGAFDCCLFAADVVLAMTDVDYAAELRGYHSKLDAFKIVSKYGSIESMISSLLGSEPVHPSLAMRGDVVLADATEGDTVGVCVGAFCVFPQETVGIRFMPRAIARLAWRIE